MVEIGTPNYAMNLSQTLSGWVIFGFSASTEGYMEFHKILSWDFTAYLPHTSVMDHNFLVPL